MQSSGATGSQAQFKPTEASKNRAQRVKREGDVDVTVGMQGITLCSFSVQTTRGQLLSGTTITETLHQETAVKPQPGPTEHNAVHSRECRLTLQCQGNLMKYSFTPEFPPERQQADFNPVETDTVWLWDNAEQRFSEGASMIEEHLRHQNVRPASASDSEERRGTETLSDSEMVLSK
ncbi:hypothetical protein EYF80_008719 [Liparis tanakae]|uniref:Uncharacterized protein n=1 Tax=Liparis tanakae TaxID=230148 RepID=A0A4Z2IV23_9TELE|nr:hypothetical protein EYF80_008719 [Liparis tanakae]